MLAVNVLRTDGDFCHLRAGHKYWPKSLRLSKYSYMTIHWKDLQRHFLMVTLVFQFTHSWGKIKFSEFFSKNLIPQRIEVKS
jgi:hypothetical protein